MINFNKDHYGSLELMDRVSGFNSFSGFDDSISCRDFYIGEPIVIEPSPIIIPKFFKFLQ